MNNIINIEGDNIDIKKLNKNLKRLKLSNEEKDELINYYLEQHYEKLKEENNINTDEINELIKLQHSLNGEGGKFIEYLKKNYYFFLNDCGINIEKNNYKSTNECLALSLEKLLNFYNIYYDSLYISMILREKENLFDMLYQNSYIESDKIIKLYEIIPELETYIIAVYSPSNNYIEIFSPSNKDISNLPILLLYHELKHYQTLLGCINYNDLFNLFDKYKFKLAPIVYTKYDNDKRIKFDLKIKNLKNFLN
tara:strand:+ start:2069 stop:2824 length:756 start_codon:yes stop_codon:yes gene_type:complete